MCFFPAFGTKSTLSVVSLFSACETDPLSLWFLCQLRVCALYFIFFLIAFLVTCPFFNGLQLSILYLMGGFARAKMCEPLENVLTSLGLSSAESRGYSHCFSWRGQLESWNLEVRLDLSHAFMADHGKYVLLPNSSNVTIIHSPTSPTSAWNLTSRNFDVQQVNRVL